MVPVSRDNLFKNFNSNGWLGAQIFFKCDVGYTVKKFLRSARVAFVPGYNDNEAEIVWILLGLMIYKIANAYSDSWTALVSLINYINLLNNIKL